MAHDILRDAPDQYMFETSQSMSRRNDQIDVVVFCKSADIKTGEPSVNTVSNFTPPVYRPHQLSHLALGIFASDCKPGMS
jgi:hypothetical protein